MRVVYWDKHGDEFWRVSQHLASVGVEVERYLSETPPTEGDAFFVHEGPWLTSIPQELRPRCVLSLCITCTPEQVAWFQEAGFKHAVLKHPNHAQVWGEGGYALRPLCPVHPVATGNGGLVSLIDHYRARDPRSYSFARGVDGLQMYGEGETQLGFAPDWEVLSGARFLVHVKHIGYLCNCVVKALSIGVPVLCDPETLEYGYDDLLLPERTCKVYEDPYSLNRDIPMPEICYQELRKGCLALRERLTTPDVESASRVADLLQRLASGV